LSFKKKSPWIFAIINVWSTKKRIAVIFGGISTEHEVSVITGLQALENLDKEKFIGIPSMSQKRRAFYGR